MSKATTAKPAATSQVAAPAHDDHQPLALPSGLASTYGVPRAPGGGQALPAALRRRLERGFAARLGDVERSTDRIRALTEPRPAEPMPLAMPASRAAQPHLREPLEMLQNERFSAALLSMQQLTEAQSSDPAALLLRAALLTHQGELEPAVLACQRLLEVDELSAGAHYLLALCCERREDLPAAVEHDLTAVYLDAGFAMPHLHLGLMARRRHDIEGARRELGQALWLLEREDASRLLLFGGGFARNALLALCRSELERLRSLA